VNNKREKHQHNYHHPSWFQNSKYSRLNKPQERTTEETLRPAASFGEIICENFSNSEVTCFSYDILTVLNVASAFPADASIHYLVDVCYFPHEIEASVEGN